MPDFYFFSFSIYWIPLLALALDLAFADPQRLPHPVQAVGFLAERMEAFCRRWFSPLVGGAVAAVLVVLHVWIGLRLLMRLPVFGGLLFLYFCWSGLALGSLLRQGREAAALLESENPDEGRRAVQMLVSRETANMDKPDLRRSLAESLSENFNDAFVAPFFWLLVGGPAGLWVYKTVSTLDSMWGYKTEKWLYFGRVAARADDVLAWLPARLSAFFLFLSAFLMNMPGHWPGWRRIREQAGRMDSPNAGWPMTVAAWLHNASMGGPTVYNGRSVDKPLLGPEKSPWSQEDLERLVRHIRLAGLLAALCMWLAVILVIR